MRRVGVEHRAHLLGGLVDLAVVVVLLPALEHEVLEEVGHPVLLGALGAGAGLEGDEDGDGARALELDAVEREAVRERRERIDGIAEASGRRASCTEGPPRGRSVPSRSRDGRHRQSPTPHRSGARAAASSPPPVEGAIIDLRSVTKRYSKATSASRTSTFAVQPGEFVFIVGASGSGKSTLDAPADQGVRADVRLDHVAGHDLGTIPRTKIPYYRRNVGVIFQDFKLLPNRTVHDNVAYALQVTGGKRREIREKVPDILRLTGLSTKLHNYPDQLSGGEQQRVSVARAFVNHPPLLLADEPTGNLDPETSIGIMQLLYRINRTGHDRDRGHPRQGDGRPHAPARDRAVRGPVVRDERRRSRTRAMRSEPRRARARDPRADDLDGRDAVGFFFHEALRALHAQRRAVVRRDGHRARHGARARRLHPRRAGDHRRGQRGPRRA